MELSIVYQYVTHLKQEQEVTLISGYGPGESSYAPPVVASPIRPFHPSENPQNENPPAFQDCSPKQMMTPSALLPPPSYVIAAEMEGH